MQTGREVQEEGVAGDGGERGDCKIGAKMMCGHTRRYT